MKGRKKWNKEVMFAEMSRWEMERERKFQEIERERKFQKRNKGNSRKGQEAITLYRRY
jgi:hypothetical protein